MPNLGVTDWLQSPIPIKAPALMRIASIFAKKSLLASSSSLVS